MQIQRVIENPLGISEEGKSLSVDSEEKNHARMKSPTSSATLTGLATANRSFLHGSDGRKTSSERSMNDRVIYATLDSLALKRTSLPLQLLPIDDANVDTVEKKEKIVRGDKRPHTNRKASPRRPSFKVRPGVPVSGQWKSHARSSSSAQHGKFENVSKELVSRLIIFENIIHNNNHQSHETDLSKSVTVADRKVPGSTGARASCNSHSNVNHSESRQNSLGAEKAIVKPPEVTNFNDSDSKIIDEVSTKVTEVESSKEISLRQKSKKKSKRYKPEFAFAKSVLHYVPLSGTAKGIKSSKISQKSRDSTSNLESARNKSFSREELRYVSISLPTNFVHLASATHDKLLPNGDSPTSSLNVITHDEKRAKLKYLGGDYQEIVIAPATSKVTDKIVKNSNDYRTTYVEIKQKSPLNFTITKRSQGSEESATSSSSSSSSSSLSLSLITTSCDSDNLENRAKVLSLENGQGVPEVVKTSENEGNREETIEEDTGIDAPVYEAMSEFSINSTFAPAIRANSNYLWREGRGNRNIEKDCGTSDEIAIEFTDNSIDDNSHDVYDDVGLSHVDTEEDHYDDVGLPSSAAISSSTDTIFEEIAGEDGSEFYDDVLPGPVAKTPENSNSNSNINDSSPGVNFLTLGIDEKPKNKNPNSITKSSRIISKRVHQSDDKNQYLSINNDYSSVEEGLDEFEIIQDDLYDDVVLPSQEKVNSLYGGSSSGSQLGSLYNGKESEWEDLEEAAPVVPLQKKNNATLRHADSLVAPSKKKNVQRWSRKVRGQKSKVSRKNAKSTSGTTSARDTSNLVDTASDDSNYESLFSFPSDEFSSCSEDEFSSVNPSSSNGGSSVQSRIAEITQEAPSRPVPPPPRETSLTETFGKRMKMLRRTWSITKGSLVKMRRRTSTTNETEANIDDVEQSHQQSPQDARKYFSFKKHFRKNYTGSSTFYLENEESNDDRLSQNNNRSKDEVYGNDSWYSNSDFWKDSANELSHRDNVDHYSILDEEPLYQFYTAATVRVAFESDSEGYEEVEDSVPSSSTADLAKPGHRTLWCQTPQVINSTLLQRLTPEEKKSQEAKFEILTSEASYLNSLRVLVDEFLSNHELVHEVLTRSERHKLFSGVPSVFLASERLLAELETTWREDPMLGGMPKVLLDYAERSSSVYVDYCSNQVSIDTTLKELRNKKGSKFVDTVTRIESNPACQSLPLHSFLMLPMQRVTRLPLLADAVLSRLSVDKKEERDSWESVLSHLSQVVVQCNEGARVAGMLVEMKALERKLEYSAKVPPVILSDRSLIRRGPVVQMLAKTDAEYKLTFGKKQHKASLYLLLLTDYLLITKRKSNSNEETYRVIDTCKRSLAVLEKVTEDSPFAGRHAMILTLLENYANRHVEYILTCENATERDRWLDAISPPKPNLDGESLYETWDCPVVMIVYPYAASQPGELTLHRGDVVNVLRKTTDGWYLGEKLWCGEPGWFPGNYAIEIPSEHERTRNIRKRHRLLAQNSNVLQKLTK